MNQTQIYSFKIFKILSCFGVVLVHYGQITHLNGSIKILTDFGAYGVYMFFIISGFLGYLSFSHSHSCRQYYLKRIFRILPLYYTVIIYNIILYELLLSGRFEVPTDSSHLGWLRYFLLLSQAIPSSDNFWVNLSATWTISHFMFFICSCRSFSNMSILVIKPLYYNCAVLFSTTFGIATIFFLLRAYTILL